MISPCTAETIITVLYTKVGIPEGIANVEKLSWEDLGVDSLGLTETVSSLEHTLAIILPLEEVLKTHNVEDLVVLINSLSQ